MIKHTRQLWPGVVALLLVTVALLGLSGSSTWANPPAQAPPVELFSFQLEHPPSGGMFTAAGATVQPLAGGDWSEMINSGFEQDFQSEGWEVQGAGWERSSTKKNSGSYSAGVENFTGAPNTRLIYGGENGFSLDDVADAKLNFSYWLDTDTDAYLGWAASADGQNFYGARTFGRVGAWLSASLDLSHLVGDDSVWIAFTISGDGAGTAQNVYVDDVTITTQEPYRVHLPLALNNYVPPFSDFEDDFSDAGSGWPIEHVVNHQPPDEPAKWNEWHKEYVNNTYHMEVNYIWFHRIFASPERVAASGDYTLQVDMMYDFYDYRAEWGLIFEADNDMESYYMVALYNYGQELNYRIRCRKSSGEEVDLAGGSAPWFFHRHSWDWSKFRIVRQGNKLYFYGHNPWTANWELINSVNASPLNGNRVGFTVFSSEQGSEAYFDNFYLWQRPILP